MRILLTCVLRPFVKISKVESFDIFNALKIVVIKAKFSNFKILTSVFNKTLKINSKYLKLYKLKKKRTLTNSKTY